MIAGIIGDIIGSVYEAHQWANKDISLIQSLPFDKAIIKPLFKEAKWVREDYSWTDDTLCTLALYKAFYTNSSPVSTMVELCKKYQNETIGFGRSFEKWLDNPVPYQSYGNGAVMRIDSSHICQFHLKIKFLLLMTIQKSHTIMKIVIMQ